MKKSLLSLLLALVPIALFGASGTAIPGGNQATSFVINKPGAYYLAANRIMTAKGQAVIQVDAPEVTIDLNGYSLGYLDTGGAGFGILVNSSSVEIKNGSISTVPYDGVQVSLGAAGVRILDLRLSDTGGIATLGAATLIERCHITDSRGAAVELAGWGNVLKDCYIYNVRPNASNAGGRAVYASTYSKIIGNHIRHTADAGIYCSGPYSVVVENQVAEANLDDSYESAGIVVSSSNVHVGGNKVSNSHGTGIRLAATSIVEKNGVCGTVKIGPLIGAGIVSEVGSTILRGNFGIGNHGGLTAGPFVDGGDNIGH